MSSRKAIEVARSDPPPNYYPPSSFEIKRMAERYNLKDVSPIIFADLANVIAGGKLRPIEWVENELRAKVAKEFPWSLLAKKYRLPDGTRTEDRLQAIEAHYIAARSYNCNVSEFLGALPHRYLPGSSPLQQAMITYKLLLSRNGEGEPGEGSGLSIFKFGKGKKVAKDIERIAEAIEGMDDCDRFLLRKKRFDLAEVFGPKLDDDSDVEDDEPDPDDEPDEDSGDGHGTLTKLQETLQILESDLMLEMIAVSRNLDEFTRMRIESGTKFIADPHGQNMRCRPIKGLHEVPRLASSCWALHQYAPTLFWYRAVTGQLAVKERGRYQQFRQLIYMLIDCSGSMKIERRVHQACGVLMNRLRGVVEREAEVYYRFFDDDVFDEYHVNSPDQARDAMSRVLNGHFSGGGTNIDYAVRTAVERCEEIVLTNQMIRPEIVVVTDGENPIATTTGHLGSVKLHAFLVGGDNPVLRQLATDSGGVALKL